LILKVSFGVISRDKKPHDPFDNGYPRDNAYDYRKDEGKIEGQPEDRIKEGEENCAEYYRQATCGKI
jgi:hypothetical protein